MQTQDKVYSTEEMQREHIFTEEYTFNLTPGIFVAKLDMKAEANFKRCLRVFFTFDDGRKVIATVHWWQKYLGLYFIPVGSRLALKYTEKEDGRVFLSDVEVL